MRLTFGKVSRATGSLECEMLESDIDIGSIVHPGFKDPEIRDKHRLRQLCRLASAKLDKPGWCKALGVPDINLPVVEDDPVGTAEAMRNAANDKALEAEKQAQRLRGRAQELGNLLQSVNWDVPTVDAARQAEEAAIAELSKTQQARESGLAACEKAHEAETHLRELEAELPDVANLESLLAATDDKAKEAAAHVNTLTKQLEEAKASLDRERSALASFSQQIETAKQQHAKAAALRATVDKAAEVNVPTEAAIEELKVAREEARQATIDAQAAEGAQAKKAQLEDVTTEAVQADATATQFRELASKVDLAVQAAVEQAGLSGVVVRGGRLCVSTDRAACEAFDERSKGQRTQQVIRWIRECRGEGTVCILDQEGWEGLDPDARKAVYEDIVGAQLFVVAAEASNGDLRVEEFVA